MFKPKIPSLGKSRWLMLEQTSQTKEEVLALVRGIDGAEIKTTDSKTYVRFPEIQTKPPKQLSKVVKLIVTRRSMVSDNVGKVDAPRQYCAVMLKNGR